MSTSSKMDNNICFYMTAFNNATDEFLEDLITAYPNIPVFELLSVLHKKFSEKDIAIPIKRFREHVMQKYGERLRKLIQ